MSIRMSFFNRVVFSVIKLQHWSFFLTPYSLAANAAHTSVCIGPMGRWLVCRFCFTRSRVGPEHLHFPTSPKWCCCLWTHLSVKQSFIISRGVIFFTVWKSLRKHKFGKEAGNGRCNLMTLIVNTRDLLKWVALFFGSHHPYRFLLTREDILFYFREDVSGVSWVIVVVRASRSGWWYNLEAFSVLSRHWNGKDKVRNDFSGDAHSWLELRTDLSASPPPHHPAPRQILSPDTVLNETFTNTESCTFYSKVFAQMRSSPSEFEIFFSENTAKPTSCEKS